MLRTLWQWIRRRTHRTSANGDAHQVSADFAQDREANRLGHMSEEDRAWERASLQKEWETREKTP